MLRYLLPYCCPGYILLSFILWAFAYHAYRVNARLETPQKRDFQLGAIYLAPVTWPVFILMSITLFVIRVVVYIIFIILFTIALVAIRKPFLLKWLDKIATKIGNKLLEANTFLFKALFGKTDENPPA